MHKLSDEIVRKYTDIAPADEWSIQTDTGWQPLIDSKQTVEYEVWRLVLSNGYRLDCADTHIVFDEDLSEVFVKDLIPGQMILTDVGPIEVKSIDKLTDIEHMYDVGVNSDDHRFYSNGVLSHNSTSAAGYLLWYAMFIPDSTILIAAHKFSGAQEIMQRIRYAYELCPDYIRAGATSYNKGSIEFDNGSRIVSQTTTETTGRGMSISLLYCLDGDTSIVQVRNKRTLDEEDISLKDLYTRLSDMRKISRDRSTQIYAENTVYEISTPSGWKDFRGISRSADKTTSRLTLSNNSTVDATIGHYFFIDGKKAKLKDIVIGDHIDTVTGPVEVTDIKENKTSDVYDVIEVDDEFHRFITNGIITKNCDEFSFVRPTIAKEFWTSISPTLSTGGKAIITSTPNSDEDQFALIWKQANKCIDEFGNETPVGINGFRAYRSYWHEHPERDEKWKIEEMGRIGEERFRREFDGEFLIYDETLINATTLVELAGSEPVERQGQVRWYSKPQKGSTYVIGLDPSLGTGGDPAAIQVFELPSFKQVAEWQHNKTPIQRQIVILKEICQYIYDCTGRETDIYYSIENNTLGEAGLVCIAEIGEENIRGLFLSEPAKAGNTRRYRKGFATSNKSKLAACAKLKSFVENNKMTISSKNLISELKTFVASGVGFAAKPGETDDLVMATILVIRMVQFLQSYDETLDERLRDSAEDYVEPMPFLANFV